MAAGYVIGGIVDGIVKTPTSVTFVGLDLPDCPACGRQVDNVQGTTPYNPDIEPLAKQVTAMVTGPMEFRALPCEHRVVITERPGGRVELAAVS